MNRVKIKAKRQGNILYDAKSMQGTKKKKIYIRQIMCEEDKRKDKKEMAKNTSKLKTATKKY